MEDYRKQGYLLENFRLFHLSSPGGTRTEFHYHAFCKLLFLLKGAGHYTIDGVRYTLQPGDVLLIRDGSIHRPELDGDVPYERVIFYISPEFLAQASTAETDLTEIFLGENGHVLRPGEKDGLRLQNLVRQLERELGEEGFGREILSTTGLVRLLVELGRCRQRGAALPQGLDEPADLRVKQILRYIDTHLGEDLDAETIAREVYLSKYHMMRLFRQETGTTVHLYITQKRLKLARELIHGGMKATEACYQSGFRSYSSFTRAAEKHLGTTPTGRMGPTLPEDEELE